METDLGLIKAGRTSAVVHGICIVFLSFFLFFLFNRRKCYTGAIFFLFHGPASHSHIPTVKTSVNLCWTLNSSNGPIWTIRVNSEGPSLSLKESRLHSLLDFAQLLFQSYASIFNLKATAAICAWMNKKLK